MPVAEALIVGGAVHGGVAAARRAVRAGQKYKLADCLQETTLEFVRTAGVNVPDITDTTDALVLLGEAVENGDIKIRWKDYPGPREALAACHRFVDAALVQILQREAEIGYKLVEAEIEYGDALPFKFIGRIDAQLKNNDVRELKTSGTRRAPDFWASFQLRSQVLPLWAAEDPFSLSLVQMVKNTTVDVRLFHLPVTDGQMIAARRMLIDVADGISSAYFPARPGYWCDFPELHQTPTFVSAA